ncbi:MAG: hypothetical protein Q9182_001053 [Xanthomendoza sp. 2 TL-2023]
MASTLNVLVITFNCARQLLDPEIFARRLANALPESGHPDLVLLSLQEVAPIAYSFLGGSYLIPYFQRFHHAVHLAGNAVGGAKYVNVITRNVGMTACMAFVLEEHTENVQWIKAGGVGLGVQEMSNKGAVGFRLGYTIFNGDLLELTFVAAHFAPMEEALQRRNEDWANTVRRLVFTPTTTPTTTKDTTRQRPAIEEAESLLPNHPDHPNHQPQSLYTPTSHLLLAGDLNYRTSNTKPHPTTHLTFPKPPHHNPSPLLQTDQLTRELTANRTCHGLSEPPITFPPTYKFSQKAQIRARHDDATTTTWEWAKHRWPSWCDRILYLNLPSWMNDGEIQVTKYTALPLMPTSDHRPVIAVMEIPLKAIPAPGGARQADVEDVRTHPPFDLDPRWRERRKVARRKEIVVGLVAYFSLTWEGRGIVVALVVGALLGWYFIRGVVV